MLLNHLVFSKRMIKPFTNLLKSKVHAASVEGFNEKTAALYEKGRPEYSTQSVHYIQNLIDSICHNQNDDVRIIELGAGTGKFTRSFFSTPNVLSANFSKIDYLATEPSEGFRKHISETIPSNVVHTQYGTGENIPINVDHSADAVIVAQAFHWMANEDTLKEIHRVLKPQRPLILIWNSFDTSVDWMHCIDRDVLDSEYGKEVPRQQNNQWMECFQTSNGKKLFSELRLWKDSIVQVASKEVALDRFMSTSVIANKSMSDQKEIEKKLLSIFDHQPDLQSCRMSHEYVIPYITTVYSTMSLPNLS